MDVTQEIRPSSDALRERYERNTAAIVTLLQLLAVRLLSNHLVEEKWQNLCLLGLVAAFTALLWTPLVLWKRRMCASEAAGAAGTRGEADRVFISRLSLGIALATGLYAITALFAGVAGVASRAITYRALDRRNRRGAGLRGLPRLEVPHPESPCSGHGLALIPRVVHLQEEAMPRPDLPRYPSRTTRVKECAGERCRGDRRPRRSREESVAR
jgi:hypothetical protein